MLLAVSPPSKIARLDGNTTLSFQLSGNHESSALLPGLHENDCHAPALIVGRT